ncbi:30S ribosomal protein S15 [endosymbiont of Sipalinus gigas]|uniref:30S ribosomal protein S15 n=1 Tax=endosymbiont of Sipalinus gigas TaxID=1972134 RepID=UPI000DC732CA|nr:30S ribosomal protein S15 [endosymbiont of Sipalinus gigas]BBA85379.1 30S ribosomal protein S15 [endosymbiont of Sipalinus gigas]
MENVGSIIYQINILTNKINYLKNHFNKNKNDFHSKRGLILKICKRKKLLKYIKNNDINKYKNIIYELKNS